MLVFRPEGRQERLVPTCRKRLIMDFAEAKKVCRVMSRYDALHNTIMEINAALNAFPYAEGETTIKIPRRYLEPLRKMMEADLAVIEEEISTL